MSDLVVTAPSWANLEVLPPGHVSARRAVQSQYDLLWIVEGASQYVLGDAVIAAPAGTMILCQPPLCPVIRHNKVQCTRQAYLIFDIVEFPDTWPPRAQWPLMRPSAPGDILHPLFEHLLDGYKRFDEAHLAALMGALVSAFVSGQTGRADLSSETVSVPVQRAIAYIYNTLYHAPMAPMPLVALAEAACVSREHLCRVFRTETGATPAETVRRVRIENAKRLLQSTKLTIGQVAERTGFSDPKHFAHCFREVARQTPSAYRILHQTGVIHTPE